MKYFCSFLILMSAIACTGAQLAKQPIPETTDIRLHIGGLASTWIYLQNVHENKKSKLDSTWVNADGHAVFAYSQALTPGFYTVELPEERAVELILDRDQTFTMKTNLEQLVKDMKVEGSEENLLLYNSLQWNIGLQERFQTEVQQLQASSTAPLEERTIDQLRQKYFAENDQYIRELIQKHPHALFAKYEKAKLQSGQLADILSDPSIEVAVKQQMMLSSFWENVDFTDARLLRTPVIYDKLWQYFNQYVPDETSLKIQAADMLMKRVLDQPAYYQFFAKWIAESFMPPFTGQMDPDAFYVHMVDNYLTAERAIWADSTQVYAWQLRADNRRISLVGHKGGDFSAKTPAGNTLALHQIKSPYVALFFYHYDCDHCIKTAPRMGEQYRKWKEQGLEVEVVAVAMDTPEAEWKQFIRENNMNFINLTDEDHPEIYDHYYIMATPEIILLNPERTIIGKHLAVEDVPIMIQAERQGLLQFPTDTVSKF